MKTKLPITLSQLKEVAIKPFPRNFSKGIAQFERIKRQLSCYVSKDLQGIVLDNYEQLRDYFPEIDYYGTAGSLRRTKEGKGTMVWRLNDKQGESYEVGYGCEDCNGIIIGQPRMEVDEDNLEHYCTNCNSLLYKETFETI